MLEPDKKKGKREKKGPVHHRLDNSQDNNDGDDVIESERSSPRSLVLN